MTIECKWREQDFDVDNLGAFRKLHPTGKNILVASNVSQPHKVKRKNLEIKIIGLQHLAKEIDEFIEL